MDLSKSVKLIIHDSDSVDMTLLGRIYGIVTERIKGKKKEASNGDASFFS